MNEEKEGLKMNLPLNQVVVGDCTEVMQGWPVDSIDLVVTSPPYWGLRDYGTETVRVWGGDPECDHEWDIEKRKISKMALPPEPGGSLRVKFENLDETGRGKQETIFVQSGLCSKCGAWRGSLGLEPHPQLFIDHLVEVCREIRRVLKPTGTFWLNLGDSYCSKLSTGSGGLIGLRGKNDKPSEFYVKQPHGFKRNFEYDGGWLQPKQKLMIPARVAIALQYDGWILRSDIIWHKPNAMPSSVKDRLTCVHEHFFMFAKHRRYYFDLDAIRKPSQTTRWGKNPKYEAEGLQTGLETQGYHPSGKNPGDIWRISTMPFPGAHFATFPPKLIEPIVKAGSPRWICSRCGKPRTRINEKTGKILDQSHSKKDIKSAEVNPMISHGFYSNGEYRGILVHEYKTVGWSDCGCGEKWIPGVVMDPFGGTGTVGRVAHRLGRSFIIIDIKPEYTEMAHQRIRGKYKPLPEGLVKLDQFMEAER